MKDLSKSVEKNDLPPRTNKRTTEERKIDGLQDFAEWQGYDLSYEKARSTLRECGGDIRKAKGKLKEENKGKKYNHLSSKEVYNLGDLQKEMSMERLVRRITQITEGEKGYTL